MRGQIERDNRKRDQDHEADQVGDNKWQNANKNSRKCHVLDYAFYDKNVHSNRRMDEAELDRHHDDDAEPDRISRAITLRPDLIGTSRDQPLISSI